MKVEDTKPSVASALKEDLDNVSEFEIHPNSRNDDKKAFKAVNIETDLKPLILKADEVPDSLSQEDSKKPVKIETNLAPVPELPLSRECDRKPIKPEANLNQVKSDLEEQKGNLHLKVEKDEPKVKKLDHSNAALELGGETPKSEQLVAAHPKKEEEKAVKMNAISSLDSDCMDVVDSLNQTLPATAGVITSIAPTPSPPPLEPAPGSNVRPVLTVDEPSKMDVDVDEAATPTTNSRPAKRRRLLMDAVIVPVDNASRAHALDAERRALAHQMQVVAKTPKRETSVNEDQREDVDTAMDVDVDVVPTFTEGSPRPDLTAGHRIVMDAVIIPFDRTSRAHADAERRTLVQPENALDPHSDPPPTTQKEKARHVVVKDEPTDMGIQPLMDVIVIPDDERQVLQQQLNSLENPKVKKPKDTFELDLDSVMARLRIHNISLVPYPVDLSADVSGVTVTRTFMSKTYGGNTQDTYPTIAKKFSDKTHLTRFAYLNLNLNPHCPCIPGAPGFQFNGICGGYTDEECAAFYEYEKEEEDRKAAEKAKKAKVGKKAKNNKKSEEEEESKKKVNVDVDEDKSEILFARLDRNEWQYEGQYIKQRVPNLTVDEWKQQPVKVRRAWGKKLSSKSYGRTIRANITLRKRLGRKPTPAEMNDALSTKDQYSTVTPEEICAAFDCGQAVIHVMSMKCVGYKNDLQRNIAKKMPTFDPTKFVQPRKAVKAKGRPVSRSKVQVSRTRNSKAAKAVATQKRAVAKKATTAKKAASTGSSISTVGGRKRKRAAMESESESEDEDVFVEENVYRHTGTRSRPIVL